MKLNLKSLALASTAIVAAQAAFADEIDFLCYQDGNECEVFEAMAANFKEKTGHTVVVNTVGYDVIRDQLLNQAQAGNAPDIARVTNPGAFGRLALGLTPYVDVEYWEANYGSMLPWFREPGGEDKGIYGWHTQLTVTGPYVNVTAFEDAGVEMPGEGAAWDKWVAVAKEAQDALGMTAGLVMDRTTHRWAGPAFSYGAKFFDESGEPLLVDEGFRNFAEVFIGWHDSGLMPAEGWPAVP